MKIMHPHTNNQSRKNESGNVLFIILIAIALLASLSYAVTQSSRGGTSIFTEEKDKLIAGEIIAYGNSLANTVGQLRLRGCTDNQISFENNVDASYTNASAPTDNSCHIFHPSGGGMNFQPINPAALATAGNGLFFGGSMEVDSIGSDCTSADCSELALYVQDLKRSMCLEINNNLDITNPSDEPPIDNSLDFTAFTGTYTYSTTIGDSATSTSLSGKKSGCLQNSSDNTYTFYRVLLAR